MYHEDFLPDASIIGDFDNAVWFELLLRGDVDQARAIHGLEMDDGAILVSCCGARSVRQGVAHGAESQNIRELNGGFGDLLVKDFPSIWVFGLGIGKEMSKSGIESFRAGGAAATLFFEKGGDGAKGFEGLGAPARAGEGVWDHDWRSAIES